MKSLALWQLVNYMYFNFQKIACAKFSKEIISTVSLLWSPPLFFLFLISLNEKSFDSEILLSSLNFYNFLPLIFLCFLSVNKATFVEVGNKTEIGHFFLGTEFFRMYNAKKNWNFCKDRNRENFSLRKTTKNEERSE